MRIPEWLRSRLRLWSIYNELGYIPWKKPKVKKERKKKGKGGVYMGAREAIPFMNNDAKRTISHLLLRPGYMMRDYIFRGQHERYLSPITALLVFYSVFTLIVAVVQPKTERKHSGLNISDDIEVKINSDSTDSRRTENLIKTCVLAYRNGAILMNLDQYPEAVDAPWKASLAAVESDLRGKGIPLFLGRFMLLWISLSLVLRKRDVSVSGAELYIFRCGMRNRKQGNNQNGCADGQQAGAHSAAQTQEKAEAEKDQHETSSRQSIRSMNP